MLDIRIIKHIIERMIIRGVHKLSTVEPGMDLFRLVKASFIVQGTYFQVWCEENGINRVNARKALVGQWNGQKAEECRKQVLAAAQLMDFDSQEEAKMKKAG